VGECPLHVFHACMQVAVGGWEWLCMCGHGGSVRNGDSTSVGGRAWNVDAGRRTIWDVVDFESAAWTEERPVHHGADDSGWAEPAWSTCVDGWHMHVDEQPCSG